MNHTENWKEPDAPTVTIVEEQHNWQPLHTSPNNIHKPVDKYRVQFSGKMLSDIYKIGVTSTIFEDDDAGEILGLGNYPRIREALPKSVFITFDGIAIDEGTRLIIFGEPDFKGTVLQDISGPLVINNTRWQTRAGELGNLNGNVYKEVLEQKFPVANRIWSAADMHG